jgi:hypothetical protein
MFRDKNVSFFSFDLKKEIYPKNTKKAAMAVAIEKV